MSLRFLISVLSMAFSGCFATGRWEYRLIEVGGTAAVAEARLHELAKGGWQVSDHAVYSDSGRHKYTFVLKRPAKR